MWITMKAKLFRILIAVQGIYTLLTALWGIFDINSFMAVTGPKADIWLVKTVSVLLVAISITLLSFLWLRSNPLQAMLLGSFTAIGLAIIDIWYAGHGRISLVYLLDAMAELVFLALWLAYGLKTGLKDQSY